MKRKIVLINLFLLPFLVYSQNKVEIQNLDNAINYALNNNYNLLIARQFSIYNSIKAKNEFGVFIPKLNFSFSDSAVIAFDSNDYRNKNLTIGLSWLIYDGGERKLEYSTNITNENFERLQTQENIANHCINIMESYYDFQKELQNKSILLQTLENANKWKQTLDKELSMGMIVETDYLEYEIKYLELEKKILFQEDKLTQLLFMIKNQLGMKIDDELVILVDTKLKNNENEDYKDFQDIFQKIINNSYEYKKMVLGFEYSNKTKKLEKLYYLPKISVEPALSFQGENFPLHGPKYQVMISLSFDRNPFFTFQTSQTNTIEKKTLTESTSHSQTGSKNDFAWKENIKISKLDLQNQIINISTLEEKIKSNLHEMLMKHKQLTSEINILEKDIYINEKLLKVIKIEIDKGIKRSLDLLEQEIILSEKKVTLYDAIIQKTILEKKLAYLISDKTGEIENAFKN